jgi:N-formylglutamate deformylase
VTTPSERSKVVFHGVPREPEAPVVFDAPHAGRLYPDDFGAAVPVSLLRGGEDRFVDQLIAPSVELGAHVLVALFARTYIDPNRSLLDIDPALLSEPWPAPLEPSPHAARGTGLVFRVIGDAVPIYDRKLPVAEVEARIESFYSPYHALLEDTLDRVHRTHGQVWYVTWHSMTSVGNLLSPDLGRPRPDFVVGDRDGSSCDPAFTELVARELRALGYTVALNDPYKGAELVARHGQPARGRHALQIEMRRALYMDETSLEKHSGFEKLRDDLARLSQRICAYARDAVV